jgi:murein DD-endopeptidase
VSAGSKTGDPAVPARGALARGLALGATAAVGATLLASSSAAYAAPAGTTAPKSDTAASTTNAANAATRSPAVTRQQPAKTAGATFTVKASQASKTFGSAEQSAEKTSAQAASSTESSESGTSSGSGSSGSSSQKQRAAKAVAFAYDQIGDPYRYGGTGPSSWDCSGLSQAAWEKAGVDLPRTTTQIYSAVDEKVSLKGAEKGDLLFFYSGRSHMGIYVGDGYMIHAPSSGKNVQKVKLSSYYKSNFNGAVRPGA